MDSTHSNIMKEECAGEDKYFYPSLKSDIQQEQVVALDLAKQEPNTCFTSLDFKRRELIDTSHIKRELSLNHNENDSCTSNNGIEKIISRIKVKTNIEDFYSSYISLKDIHEEQVVALDLVKQEQDTSSEKSFTSQYFEDGELLDTSHIKCELSLNHNENNSSTSNNGIEKFISRVKTKIENLYDGTEKPKKRKKSKPGTKIHSCDTCSYTSTHLTNLRTHMRSHTGEKPFTCDKCSYSSYQLGHLQAHILLHTGQRPFACNLCCFTSRVMSHLKRHKKVHIEERPFACNLCSFKSMESNKLKSHTLMHTDGTTPCCQQCNFTCKKPHQMRRTRKRIPSDERRLDCDQCSYKAKRARHLVAHMRTHSGEKPFACDKCAYVSSQIGHLNVHKRIHTGEKPYPCNKCEYAGRTSRDIKYHSMTHLKNK